ncbi:M14 family zinc carboxypeptidase [Roseivirga sp. E12]|uniref:M14 family zinc carboxypeptidase n=1 Tax=Roseivirga sp. E12 TaxID=2819237 RepID=UPI001ABD06FB|nr:M14 family zinc carboxypeptidase [Roseivirga sp. E12]MBO3696824.1 zinc carboxypeptidase [Roseivirga sp. E12]
MKNRRLLTLLGLILCLGLNTAIAQSDYFFPPNARFDESIPTPEEYLGYPIGTLHTRHDAIVGYMRELARISDRAELDTIGETYEHRLLVVLKVTSPENHGNLEQIRSEHLKLVDPSQAIESYDGQKSIVLLGYNVHGNEPSSSEAALLTAYYYVAGRHAEVTDALDDAVLLIDPAFNPDGRDRHSTWANSFKGDPMVSDPIDAEHNEMWPRGRTNHYWFDLNRDWLPLAHVESQARINFYHKWYPNVVTDFHEMGTNSTYFFEPTKPFGSENPVVPRDNYDGLNNLFAGYFHEALDEIGSLYFTKEQYDNSYPGYGSTYPDIHGALGLVFEQASSRGHLQDSRMGKVAFAFTIKNHLTSSMATVRASVGEKETLLKHMENNFNTAVEEGKKAGGGWVFGDQTDEGRNGEFIDLLNRHQIEMVQLNEDITLNGRAFKAGNAFYVPNEQKQYRMVRTMFEQVTTFYDSIFYDASSWTTALTYNMPYERYTGKASLRGMAIDDDFNGSTYASVPKSNYAYLIEWDEYYSPKALNYLLEKGLYVNTAFKPFSIETNDGIKDFGYGTLMIPVNRQEMNSNLVHGFVEEATDLAGIRAYSVKSGFSAKGIDLGSGNFRTIRQPKAVMLIGGNVSSTEAGEIWHLLDTKVGMPVTKVMTTSAGRIDWAKYNTLILPSANYSGLGKNTIDRIKQWVREGGTVITLRSATSWAISSKFVNEKFGERPERDTPERMDYVTSREFRGSNSIGGSMYMTDVDITHPLAFGYTQRDLPVYRNHSIFMAPSEDPFSTVVKYKENPLLSGYVNKTNLEKLGGTASLIVSGIGRGNVIMFADNPNFRGMWYGTNKLFFNALFLGNQF